MNAPFDELTRIVREAPGGAAARGVLTILATLAHDGNGDAALTLGRIVSDELGLADGESAWPDTAPESMRTAELPALVKLLVLGYAPTTFLADVEYVVQLASEADRSTAYGRIRELVRRAAPAQDLALATLILAEFAEFLSYSRATFGDGMSASAWQRTLRRITDATRIVPGDSVDSTFSVGRDFVLGSSFATFSFTIQHELGHHISDHIQSGVRDSLAGEHVRALARAVGRVLTEAGKQVGLPLRIRDTRRIRLPFGLQVICTVATVRNNAYTHFSLSQAGGPIDHGYAIACVYLIAELLGVGPDTLTVAYSPAGLCHLAMTGVPRPSRSLFRRGPDPAGIAERAHAWFAELTRAGRVGRDEEDLVARLFGTGEPRTYAYPATSDTMGDLAICARLRHGEPAGMDRPTRLRAAVACGDPAALRLVLADEGQADQEMAGLARLGESRCVVVADTVAHTGSSAADLRDVLVQLHGAGFDIDEPVTKTGGTLLSDAAVRSAELTWFLIGTGADVNRRDRGGATPLAEAARCGNWQVCAVLVGAGARPDERDGDGRTALHHAAMSGSAETAARVLAGGAAVTATDARGVTPLAHASTATVVTLLCREGAEPNAVDSIGHTPLMEAACRGNAEVATALLRHGADPAAVADTGETALHYAVGAAGHRVDVITALLDAGAEIDEENDEGITALMAAAAADAHDDAVAVLLERGADPNARSVIGQTALMRASEGRTEWTRDFAHNDRMKACMRLLVGAGADVDAADEDGWTALHYACLGFDAGPVEQLLELGANPNVKSRDGTTPLAQAKANGHQKMIEDLTKAGARQEVR